MCEYLEVTLKASAQECAGDDPVIYVEVADPDTGPSGWKIVDCKGTVIKAKPKIKREDILKCHRALMHEKRGVLVPV